MTKEEIITLIKKVHKSTKKEYDGKVIWYDYEHGYYDGYLEALQMLLVTIYK